MKFVYLTIVLCLFSSNFLYTQKYNKAVVTDLNYSRRYNELITEQSYPYYFFYQEFIDDIHTDIAKHIKARFNTDTVIFSAPGKINYQETTINQKITARDTAKLKGEKGTIYVGIETVLHNNSIINGETINGFTTRVKVYNHKGKKIYRFKNLIPFTPIVGEEITGNICMSEDDFYTFYFDGLAMAFEGKTKKTERRYNYKPQTNYYNVFLANAEKFYLGTQKRGYIYGKTKNELKEILYFKNNFWHSADGNLDLGDLFESTKVNDGYNVINRFKDEEYLVKLSGGESTLFNILTLSSDIEIKFMLNKKELIGLFKYDYNDEVTGTFKEKKYITKVNWEFNCTEFYNNDKLIIVIHNLPDTRIVFISNEVSEGQLGDMFNIVMAYDFAVLVKQKLEANSRKNRED